MRKPPQRVAGHANSDVCSDTPELAARELAVHPNPPSSPQEDAYKIARSGGARLRRSLLMGDIARDDTP